MFKLASIKKLKAVSAVLAASLMVSIMAPITYADNVGATVKAVNVMSYKLVDSTHLNIYFDKGLYNFTGSQVKVMDGNTALTFSAAATTGGCDWNCATPPGGTAEQLTFSGALSTDHTYTVKVSSTVTMGNAYHLNVGNYWGHNDIVFNFRTPSDFSASPFSYTGTPALTFIPGDLTYSNGIGASANVEVIADRPIDPTTVDLANEAYLLEDTDKNGSYETTVTVDTGFDSTAVSGAQCYVSQLSKSGTVLFIPETCGGSTTAAYNLDDSANFKFVLPDTMQDISGNYFDGTDKTFSTGADTVASLGNLTVTASNQTTSSVDLSWSDVAADDSGVAPNHYHVYYSTDPYFGFNEHKSTDTITHNGSTNTVTVTGLSSGTTYYFRVVGATSTGEEGGFSPYVSRATN